MKPFPFTQKLTRKESSSVVGRLRRDSDLTPCTSILDPQTRRSSPFTSILATLSFLDLRPSAQDLDADSPSPALLHACSPLPALPHLTRHPQASKDIPARLQALLLLRL